MRYRMKSSRGAPHAVAVAVLIAVSQVGTGETRGTVVPVTGVPGANATLARAGAAAGQQSPAGLDYGVYREQIEPLLLLDRGGYGPGVSACVTCHIQSGTPMRLEPLEEDGNGGVYWTEEQSRRNFDRISGLVAPGQPEQSRLLRAPLELGADGSDFHVGGKFWESQDDPEWQAMAVLVSAADPVAGSPPAEAAPELDFEFFSTCVQQIFLDREDEADRMECAACHGTGIRGFAQQLPEGRDFWNQQESLANFGLIMRYVDAGNPLGSRLLTHPLDPHDGGDNYHSGGRRWHTQDDPEWQMLAAWVMGEAPACVVEDR